MSKRRVLVIGDDGVALFLTNGKAIKCEGSLPWLVPNFEDELIDLLRSQNKGVPVFILYDALEQQYRKEDIIKTNILDQKKLVKRKLGALFSNILAYSYIELKTKGKKSKEKKTHLSYLIAAVPNTEQIERIAYSIGEAQVDISGFALLPVESSGFVNAFIKKISHKNAVPRWVLMISHHETGGIRQIFIKDGALALTRLSPLSDDNKEATHWSEEVYKGFTTTLSYISRYGFTPSDGLDVIVICDEQNKALLKTYDFKDANLQCYSVEEAANLFNFSISSKKSAQTSVHQYADMLHAGWIARQRSIKMPFKIDWIRSIAIPRRIVRVASFLMFLTMVGAMFLSFETFQQFNELKEEIEYKETQRTVLNEEYEQESKIFDNLPIKPITIHAAMESKEALEKESLYSYELLEKIKSVLGNRASLIKLSYLDARNPEDSFSKKKVYTSYSAQNNKKTNIKELQVTLRFVLDDAMLAEDKIKTVKEMKISFEKAFPKSKIRIVKQYGNSNTAVGALSGQLWGNDIANEPQQVNEAEAYAEISIMGEHL